MVVWSVGPRGNLAEWEGLGDGAGELGYCSEKPGTHAVVGRSGSGEHKGHFTNEWCHSKVDTNASWMAAVNMFASPFGSFAELRIVRGHDDQPTRPTDCVDTARITTG